MTLFRRSLAVLLAVSLVSCWSEKPAPPDSAADAKEKKRAPVLVHLDERLDEAYLEGSAPREGGRASMHWSFPDDQGDWRAVASMSEGGADFTPAVEPLANAVRLGFDRGNDGRYGGYYLVDLPDLASGDWIRVEVRMSSKGLDELSLGLNLREGRRGRSGPQPSSFGQQAQLVSDGEPHTYSIGVRSNSQWGPRGLRGSWSELILVFESDEPGTTEIESVSLISKSQDYAGDRVAARTVSRGGDQRQAIVFHAPGKISFDLQVPAEGRLDAAVGTLSRDEEVTFRARVRDADGADHVLWEQTLNGMAASETEAGEDGAASRPGERVRSPSWVDVSADLSAFADQDVEVILEGTAPDPGSVAFWSSPTISGRQDRRPPNVILYVIDGAGADLMSVYGYERKTTPNLERLAKEGTVFEHAHTNSGWTKSSTASFMTSLHHSILGGFASNSDQIPAKAVTMAQRFRGEGYQTAVFTSNPFAGSLSGLQRDVDVFRDQGAGHNSASSAELHREFWEWRESWPGMPYWVHFQTTDVHEPWDPPEGFAGMFVNEEQHARHREIERLMRRGRRFGGSDSILGGHRESLKNAGVDPKEYFALQNGLYDETMAHNDHQIGLLVKELKDRGEWENTLFIVAADHGHPAGSFSRFGRGQLEPPPEDWEGAIADSYRSHIPLIMFWPGHIPADKRIDERVSMIDLLPTALELTGLQEAEVQQGRSLVPLMQGDPGWTTQPVVFDQFQADSRTGEMAGHVEMIDGRWAASLEIVPDSFEEAYRSGARELSTAGGWRAARPHRHTTPALLLYDIVEDPFCTKNVNDAHPELVQEYTERLIELYDGHLLLAQRFSGSGGEATMTAEQLATLRALGYIR